MSDQESKIIREEDQVKELGHAHHQTSLIAPNSFKNTKQLNLSFLVKKDILEQIKDYVNQKNYRKDPVISLYKKLHTKLLHWELNTDKNKEMLTKAIHAIFVPQFFQYLSNTSEMEKTLELLQIKDIPAELKLGLISGLLKIAKNLQYRSSILRSINFGTFLNSALEALESQTQSSEESQEKQILEGTIKVLCELASPQGVRYYIPGETSEILKIQKEAIDSGVYLALFHTYLQQGVPASIKEIISSSVIQRLEITELNHHQQFLKSFSSSTTNLLRNEGQIQELLRNQEKAEMRMNKTVIEVTNDGGETPPPKTSNKILENSERKHIDAGPLTHRPGSQLKMENERRNSGHKKQRILPSKAYDFQSKIREIVNNKQSSRGPGPKLSHFTEGPMGRDALAELHIDKDLLKKVKIPSIKRFLSERVMEIHEEQHARQEIEIKRKLERLEQENKVKEQRERDHEERKKKAEEIFKRRVEETRKRQEQEQKKLKLEQELRQIQQEERRVRMMELIKKRDQDRKLQRLDEERRKKQLEMKKTQEFLELRKQKMEEQKRAYDDWSKQKLREEKLKKKKPMMLRKKAELEQRLDNILISEGYEIGKLGSPPRHKSRKTSLPVTNLASTSVDAQNLIEVVAYSPKDQRKPEDRLNLTADQSAKHKKIQSLSTAAAKQESLEKISNNLYFEFHTSDSGTPDLQNVVFSGKPKGNPAGTLLIKQKDQPSAAYQQGRQSVERGAQSVSPQIASLLTSPLKENVPKRILGNTASKQSLPAKKSFQSEILSKNVRRYTTHLKGRRGLSLTGSKKQDIFLTQLSMKDALAKDSLVSGELLFQSPEPLNISQLEAQVEESREQSEEERSATQIYSDFKTKPQN